VLKLILFVLPLGFDTFAVAAALGIQGLPAKERLKASLLMSSFEMAMPVVGLLLGRGLGAAIGSVADYLAAGALGALGLWMLLSDEEGETEKVGALSRRSGLALLGLGISISLDELAMGFTIGLLQLSIVLAVILIGLQAFVLAQLGLRLGARLGAAAREWAERLAGIALLGLAVLVIVEKIVT
jgi:putative Mn2+ efflux pump MntP